MIWLLKQCKLAITVSGGLQKETYFFEKSYVTTRDETVWVELIECGASQLVGADKTLSLKTIIEIEHSPYIIKNMANMAQAAATCKLVKCLQNLDESSLLDLKRITLFL
jgi:UDP-GlcNAc3NAcA epimerase